MLTLVSHGSTTSSSTSASDSSPASICTLPLRVKKTGRKRSLLEEAPGALTYPKLCALYTQYVPYLEAYPGLTADALFTLVSDNLLDAFYPLDKPLDPQRSHAAAANYLATRR